MKKDRMGDECGICIEPMQTLAYIAPPVRDAEDCLDALDPTCMRLKCGHAFHFSCQAPAMRMGKFCSLCRDEIKKAPIEIQINGETWEFSPSDVEQAESINEANEQLSNALMSVHEEELDMARKKMKEALKVHRKIANDLKKFRARSMREALKNFRQVHKRSFDESVERVKKLLHVLKKCEREALRTTNFTPEQIQVYFSTDVSHNFEGLVSNGAEGGDPARHRFWYR